MRSGGAHFLTRVLPGAVVLFLAGGVVVPSQAVASCGDYVMLGTHHAPERSNAAGHAVVSQDDRFDLPQLPNCPCRGATCSQGGFPELPPVPRPTTNVEQWAWQSAVPTRATDLPFVMLAADAPLEGGYSGLSVFRPPRSC